MVRRDDETCLGVLDTEELSSILNPHQRLSILSNSNGALPAAVHTALLATYQAALRADSANAPSTHADAAALDAAAGNALWSDGEEVELGNHDARAQRVVGADAPPRRDQRTPHPQIGLGV